MGSWDCKFFNPGIASTCQVAARIAAIQHFIFTLFVHDKLSIYFLKEYIVLYSIV